MASQILSTKYPFIGNSGFDGGLSSENPIAIAPNKLTIADNILVGTAPTRRKRGGMERYYNAGDDLPVPYPDNGISIRGIIEFWRTAELAGNPISDIFLHQGTKIWSIDDRNTAAVDRTGALTLSSDSVPCYQPFNQQLFFCSTITADGYNKWDGASASAAAANPPDDGPGKYLCSHLGRMIMAGNDDFPFRIYFSSAFDPEIWDDTDPNNGTSLDLDDKGDPQGITGIVSFQRRLYVFTRRSTYEITGTTPEDFVVNLVTDGIGCVGHASITSVPNDIIFCSDRGIHSLRQLSSGLQTESTFLSRDIQRLWTGLVNSSRFRQFMGSYDETINSYVLTVVAGSDTTNSDCLVYNIEFGTWTQWKNINARSISIAFLSNSKQLIIGREDGSIAFLNRPTRTDFGDAYSAQFKTGVLYPGGDITIDKKFMNVTVLASVTAPATIGVSWNIDGKREGTESFSLSASEDLLGSTFVLGQSILGIGQYLPYTINIGQVGGGITLSFSVQSEGDIEFYGFVLEVENANPVFGSRTN